MFFAAVRGGNLDQDREKRSVKSREVDRETENDRDRKKDGEERVQARDHATEKDRDPAHEIVAIGNARHPENANEDIEDIKAK